MAVFTPLSLDEARALGALYGLRVAAVRGIPAGSVNSNFELALEPGARGDPTRAFLRVYEEQGHAAAAAEARLLDHLAAGGVPTPRPLPLTGGGYVAEHAGKAAAVFPWVEGASLCQGRVTPEATRAVGAALAGVHLAGAAFEGAPPSRYGAPALRARLAAIAAAAPTGELGRLGAELSERLDREEVRVAAPAGLAHGDLFRDNVLWRGGALVALLDFESASRESHAFDLMVTLLAWSFGAGLDQGLARALVAGYAAVRPLSAEDRAALHPEGCFAALRFTITRITDFELRPRGLGVFKDYRRFLARLAALDALGPRGLLAFLDA